MAGRYDEACEHIEAARITMREFNFLMDLAQSAPPLMYVHQLGSHLERAEEPLREAIDFYDSVGDREGGPYWPAKTLTEQADVIGSRWAPGPLTGRRSAPGRRPMPANRPRRRATGHGRETRRAERLSAYRPRRHQPGTR